MKPCSTVTSINKQLKTMSSEPIQLQERHHDVVRPVLKWVGGKSQIMKKLLSTFPRKMKSYHEPFVGGGSVLLGLLSYIEQGKIVVDGDIYVSDANKHLINMYKSIQKSPHHLVKELGKLCKEYHSLHDGRTVENPNRKPMNENEAKTSSESYYYWIRHLFNTMKGRQIDTVKASAKFIFLNKTCWRGVYRESKYGFNVPYGHYKNPSVFDEQQIIQISSMIRNVHFNVGSFEDSIQNVSAGDFVYFDPPYFPENDKSFTDYTKLGFELKNHETLFGICHTLKDSNIHFVMSNSETQKVIDEFKDGFRTEIISCRRVINSKNPCSRTNEVIITPIF